MLYIDPNLSLEFQSLIRSSLLSIIQEVALELTPLVVISLYDRMSIDPFS